MRAEIIEDDGLAVPLLVLRKELIDRLAIHRSRLEWQRIVDDLADLSERTSNRGPPA